MKEVVVVVGQDKKISVVLSPESERKLYKNVMAAVEKPLLEDVLIEAKGNQLKAARILGINRNTLRTKIKKLEIDIRGIRHGVPTFPRKTRAL
jgi:DNA-binding NtrC family response regulator